MTEPNQYEPTEDQVLRALYEFKLMRLHGADEDHAMRRALIMGRFVPKSGEVDIYAERARRAFRPNEDTASCLA